MGTRGGKVFRGAHPCRLTQKACHGLSSVSAPNSLSIAYLCHLRENISRMGETRIAPSHFVLPSFISKIFLEINSAELAATG